MITLSAIFNPERASYSLKRMAQGVSGTKTLLRRVGLMLFTEYTRSMRSGVDPRGHRLAPVARWTRVVGVTRGTKPGSVSVPLVNTGSLNRNMAVKEVTNERLVFGFRGKFQDVADRMQSGTVGQMAVKSRRIKGQYSGIRKAKDGHLYCSILGDSGWFTKQIVGGNKIVIRPRVRKFFYLTRAQMDKIDSTTEQWVKERLAASAG